MEDLTQLLRRSSDLKRQLVGFATQPRFEEHLNPLLHDVATSDGQMTEPEFIQVLDAFIMQHRFKDGSSVIDRFLQSRRRELDEADTRLLLGWKDPVQGVFQLTGAEGESSILHNLIDDMVYRAYSNTGKPLTELGPDIAFVTARLAPLTADSWVVSGSVQTFPPKASREVARTAIEMAAEYPEFVFRNPEKVRVGWERMALDRDRFITMFGADEVIAPPADAQARLSAYYGNASFSLPESLTEHDTVGLIFDPNDGLMLLPSYGALRELFADPGLLADPYHAEALREYLKSDSIGPSPLRRLAESYPGTVDALLGQFLRKPAFRWGKDGETLLHKNKAWYFTQEPRPSVSVISDQLYAMANAG